MDPRAKKEQRRQDDAVSDFVPVSKYSNRVELQTLLNRADGGSGLAGKRVVVGGWVKSSRAVKKETPPTADGDKTPAQAELSCTEIIQSRISIFRKLLDAFGGRSSYDKPASTPPKPIQPPSYLLYFLISDGSCVATLQVVVDSDLSSLPASRLMSFGTCFLVEGLLRYPTAAGGKHQIELQVEKILHVGTVDPEKYPLSKKQLPLHMLRDYSHFRARTTTVASVTRIHGVLVYASHLFFHDNGFHHVQVPIITTTDAEGSGKRFNVTTVLGESKEAAKEGLTLDTLKAAVREKTKRVEELKRSESNRESLVAALQDLKKTTDLASWLEARQKSKAGTKTEKVEASDEFFARERFMAASGRVHLESYFGQETFLTLSGRLHLESYACALGNVYTFGPRFRADKVDSPRHVAEMWNIETEMAFAELDTAMTCAEDLFKFLCRYILEHRSDDMKFISKRIDKTLVNSLEALTSSPIAKFSYSDVMKVLQRVQDKKFELKPEFGVALSTEHLSYLAEQIYKAPVFIYNYPKRIKPFNVRLNDDGNTVAAFDLVVPKIGILISGSQSEERYNELIRRIKELGLSEEQYEWYFDLRRHGTAKHSGFSLRFDLMVQLATSLPDVRDVAPFPRSFGKVNH